MFRIVVFLAVVAIWAAGAAWVADQTGDVVLSWGGWHVETSMPVFVLLLGLIVLAAMMAWATLREIWRMPERVRRKQRERRLAKGRHAVTQGLLAIGHGDSAAARRQAALARKFAPNDPLALLLHAQSAQLDGDRAGAHRSFSAMAKRGDTRLLGLRGLFVEAQRSDDPVTAVEIAEEALKLSPGSTWASHALLGFRCAQGDWNGALALLDSNLASGLLDKPAYRRQRGVLLTARALELEQRDRDLSRTSIAEAVKLAPTLVPAAVLAAKFQSEANQIRRAMKILETAWLAQPHPDLADAYAHVKPGDSARQRLARVETLAAKAPGHIEGVLAVARAALDASEFGRAREVLAPFVDAPTQRVAMLMAELERLEHGDSGRARAWTLRAVRAAHDPVWTADGYVSDRWRPVSPVTGRLDAFQWQTPLAALPSEHSPLIDPDHQEPMFVPPRPPAVAAPTVAAATATGPAAMPPDPAGPVIAPDNTAVTTHAIAEPASAPAISEPAATAVAAEPPPEDAGTDSLDEPVEAEPARPETPPAAPPPLFRSRPEIARAAAAGLPVIPIVRPPDDPGVDDEGERDEFAELNGARRQAGGWRGFLNRWGG